MEDFNKIQDYLLNNLSEEDKKNFEAEIIKNPQLASLLELQRFEMETIDQMEEDALREKAKTIRDNNQAKNKEAITKKLQPIRSKKRNWPVWAAAASIALLIGFFLLQNPFSSNQNLTAYAYSEESPSYSISTVRASGEEVPVFDNQIITILQSRDQANVEKAIQYFSTFISKNPNELLRAKINLGHAFLLNKNFDKAIETFTNLSTSNNISDRDKEEVIFYQALTLLEIDKTEGVNKMKEIQNEGKRFGPLAQKILDLANQK